jgi:lupus La protein
VPKSQSSEIFVEFLGAKLRVLEEDGGSVAVEDVPRVRGSALRFVGCAGEVSFDEIKRPLKERFSRAPFVKFTKGDDAGLVGFDKALDEDDIAFVKEKIPMLNGKPITWELPEGMLVLRFVLVGSAYPFFLYPAEEDVHAFGIERANAAAKRALGGTESTRGGRGGGRARGGRGGRGGGRDRGARRNKGGTATIARRMAGTNRQARSGRGPWSRTVETTPGCAGKWCLPSCRPPHQKSQRRTAESREYGSWQSALMISLLVAIKM